RPDRLGADPRAARPHPAVGARGVGQPLHRELVALARSQDRAEDHPVPVPGTGHVTRHRASLVALATAAACAAAVPASALAQAAASSGSAASEYGDYVPSTSGSTSHSSAPTHTTPPRATPHYTAPSRTYTP